MCLVHGQDVVAVHPDDVHLVAIGPGCHAIGGELFGRRGGDGVTVIPAQENHRYPVHRGHVQGRVKITLGGGAFAEIGNGAVTFAGHFLAIGVAGGLRDLSGQRRRNGHVIELFGAVVNRHLTALAVVQFVAEQLVHELIDTEAAVGEGTLFPGTAP